MATFLSIPPPQSLLLPHRRSPSYPYLTSSRPLIISALCCASSPQTPLVAADDSPAPSPPPPDGVTSLGSDSRLEGQEGLQFRGCKTCGREEIEKGCNGEGRIQGGIATIPGFGWWPIKAYRPCPGFVASGGKYRRSGQSMDDVASGRGKRAMSTKGIDKVKSRSSERR